jgi:hypothetical protein
LNAFVEGFARAIERVDSMCSPAVNQRSGVAFRPGIGPYAEAAAVRLIMGNLSATDPNHAAYGESVPYPALKRQRCDLCLGEAPNWEWNIEVKLLRFLGDNGQPNDNILMHILSPYPAHRSAVTDCEKLLSSGFAGRKAILIYGFEHDEWPLEPAIEAFEALARLRVRLGLRTEGSFSKLVHPVHSNGRVFAWEIEPLV